CLPADRQPEHSEEAHPRSVHGTKAMVDGEEKEAACSRYTIGFAEAERQVGRRGWREIGVLMCMLDFRNFSDSLTRSGSRTPYKRGVGKA
ncbi:hypothetical protein, partial [Roseateles sp.]|uniref:hypothetical protein n=1 Tax=Roseateles sp. TaxID=1971397 RepID=UPI00286C75C2